MACLYAIMKYIKRFGYKQLGQNKKKSSLDPIAILKKVSQNIFTIIITEINK